MMERDFRRVPAGTRPSLARRLARAALTRPWVLDAAAACSAGHPAILLSHRFTDRAHDDDAFPVGQLARSLEWLRAHRYRLVRLDTLLDELAGPHPIPPKTVAFTVDDGYADFAELAWPVFKQFDCPVSVFLVTGFVDGRQWLWWDRLEVVFTTARADALQRSLLGLGMAPAGPLESVEDRRVAAADLAETVKWRPAAHREQIIDRIVADTGVELPGRPTDAYRPMSWDAVRALSGALVSFGPHTVTHPILAQESDDVARDEIQESWQRLRTEVLDALPVFCYPNGDPRSFGTREEREVLSCGLRASLSTVGDYASQARVWDPGAGRCGPLPRLQFEGETARFRQVVSGVDRIKRRLLWPQRDR